MKSRYGICTNQPSLCTRAKARVPTEMTAPDTRCPECGKPLLPVPGLPGEKKGGLPPVAIIAGVVVVGALAAGLFWMGRGTPSASLSSSGAASVPVTASAPPPPDMGASSTASASAPAPFKSPFDTPASAPEPPPAPSSPPPAPAADTHHKSDRKPDGGGAAVVKPTRWPYPDACTRAVPNWAGASCAQIKSCWKFDDWAADIEACSGLSPEVCAHIKSCGALPTSN